ncbi:hypothetical protein Shyd_16590 [Streptomyces hydrogenans]|uniref:Uncharacterized protein n=1 Tax=Streptomyces hydrogenans TaxID=1873719 RepID=A0ABQ3P5I7_9ACTN|nr:hypothetical protein [Streptomyces hydrogenans]GHI20288.1 hypothetical protein Shyd_16590 [Streptomyces hydrogenans]
MARGAAGRWSARETAAFRCGIAAAEVRVHRDVADEDERLAVARDAARAAALAEPVRRIAQPRPARARRQTTTASPPPSTTGSSTS